MVSPILPILAFMLVFLVTYALLAKTKIIGGNSFVHSLVSFLIAIIFAVSPSATEFTVVAMPWVAVLIMVIFVVLMTFSLVKGNIDDIVKSPIVSLILVAIVLIIFIAAAINVFSPFFSQYMPGEGQKPGLISFLINPAILGGIILLIIAAIATWILSKK